MPRVLIIDDEESICWGLAQLCQQMDLESATASTAERGLELLQSSEFDVVIMDVRLPGMDGLSAIQAVHQKIGKIPIITITAFGDLQTAIGAVQQGAFEYLVKPFALEQVRSTLEQALAARKLMQQAPDSESQSPTTVGNGQLIGSSPFMQEVYKQIALTTTTQAPVLITGESGTGKELTARSIHRFGPRADGPFVAVNIAALSPTLAESELFGHVKGAFTGADADRKGLIQQAHGGTLFLDEVAEIPLELQVKLLRVLDLNEVTPVGSNHSVKTDFRLISATHQDLLSQVNHGEFRHDLFYRLRTFEIRLPSLRQRKQDIPELVEHFLKSVLTESVSVTPDFLHALQQYHWPGNVRELQSVVARAATLARGGVLTAEQVEPFGHQGSAMPSSDHLSTEQAMQQLVQRWTRENWDLNTQELYEHLLSVIDPAILSTAFELADQQYSAAARRLGIHRTTLKKKLEP